MADEIRQTMESHGKQIDFIVNKVLEQDGKLELIGENMATKADIHEITNTLDVLVKLAQKKDQELTFMGNRINRIEEQTNENMKDIRKMKPVMGIS